MGKPYSQDLRERVIAAYGAYVAAPLFRGMIRKCLPGLESGGGNPFFEKLMLQEYVRGRSIQSEAIAL